MMNFEKERKRQEEMEKERNSKRGLRRRAEEEARENFKEETEFKKVTDDEGIMKRMIKMGFGDLAERGQKVDIHLEGRFLNGEIFLDTENKAKNEDKKDSAIKEDGQKESEKQDEANDEQEKKEEKGVVIKSQYHVNGENNNKDNTPPPNPLKVELGRRDLIRGLEIAITTMKQGEVSEFKFKPSYAYGPKGSQKYNIPPDTEIMFTVKLKFITEPDKKAYQYTTKELVLKSEKFRAKGKQDFEDEEYKDALKNFEKSLNFIEYCDEDDANKNDIIDKKVTLYCNMCNCFMKLKKWEDVIKHVKVAIKINPKHPKPYYFRGVIIVC